MHRIFKRMKINYFFPFMNQSSRLLKPILHRFAMASCALLMLAAIPASAQVTGTTQSGLPVIRNAPVDESGNGELFTSASAPPKSASHDQHSPFSQPSRARTASDKDSFEKYVELVVDKSLNVFGKNLFGNVPDTFAPVDGVQVNPDYVIGAGDELQIRGWGMVDIDFNTTVDRSGSIYLPRVGTINVAGIKYRDVQDYLRKAISRIYSNFDLTVSIAQTRAVQVYVVGHAVRPGTYTLSAMSTLLNALFVSGGPNGAGTMRNIQVKRGTNTVTTFDVYDMLIKGDKSRDIALQDGDVIYIPEVGPLVALTGDIKQPAIFELKESASVADIIAWAGGFDSAADGKQVLIEKNIDNNFQGIAEIIAGQQEGSSALRNIPVRSADIIRVFSPAAVPVQVSIPNEYVRVAGEVRHSGVFQIQKGDTLRTLLLRLGGVTEDGYVYAMKLNRESVRRTQQARLDEVALRFERDIESAASQRLGSTADKENADVINIQIARQRRLAERLRAVRADGRIVLELANGAATVEDLPDLPLHNGDSIYIPRRPGTVNVLGAVFQQNAFIYRDNRAVNDYLALAGGATGTADLSELYVIRADGTTQSTRNAAFFSPLGYEVVNAGDTIVLPESIERRSWIQSLKEWTTILYQFGLGAAGIKVLQD